MPYREGENGGAITVIITGVFRRGADNYVQVRARDVIGNLVTSPIYNVKVNTIPVLVITSPNEGDDYYEDQDIVFDASGSYDVDGDGLPSITWVASDGRTVTPIGENIARVESNLKPGVWTITVTAKDKVGNEVMKVITLNVLPKIDEIIDNDEPDRDLDGMYDWWEIRYLTKVDEKDEMEDPDEDRYVNLYEFQNNTDPQNPRSHPVDPRGGDEVEDLGPFSVAMWPLWVLMAVLVIAILVVMVIARSRQESAVKRIKAVRNMRRIMPSVSWDQITTTAYIAPMTQGAMLPGAAAMAGGPALPAGALEVPADRTLPPAPEAVVQAQPAAQPVVQPATVPEGTFQAAPAPAQYSLPLQNQ
jgi:hypothetical protein